MKNIALNNSLAIETILTKQATEFLTNLHLNFDPERRVLLQMRSSRHKIDNGELPDFLTETAHIRRDSSWHVAPIPNDLLDIGMKITVPTERKAIINAINSGANGFIVDFTDTTTWSHIIDGHINTFDTVHKTIDRNMGKNKTATLWVRPRSWHLNEDNFMIDKTPISAGLFDFGLFIFHNGAKLLSQNTAPYLYLPNIEILHELKNYICGISYGRIEKLHNHREYSQYIAAVCQKRGANAMEKATHSPATTRVFISPDGFCDWRAE